MFRKLTLSLILTVSVLLVGKFSFATNYVNNGASTTYNLNSGDSVFFASGTYTGTIGSFPSGAKITVSDMAIFSPSVFPNTNGNSAAGTMYIYGTFSFSPTFLSNTGFTLNNYGVVSLSSVTMKGSNQFWTNNFGAVLNFSGDVLVNSTSESNNITNYGTINSSTNFTMTTLAVVTNYKNLNVGGEFKVNGGTLENRGKIETTGLLNFNNGASVIKNYCGMSSKGGIRNTSDNFYNYSYLWAKNDLGLGNITNSGKIFMVNWNFDNPTQAMIHGKNYTQTGGSITGKGWMYFYGTTTQSGGITGAAGVTTDTLKMYDITRVNTTIFYDPVQAGTVYPNAIYNAWGVPDSTRAYFVGCSVEIIMEVPLAINWNNFDVTLSDNTPLLTWSASFGDGTIFDVQRSYDGRNFSTIKEMPAEAGRTEYDYTDKLVNKQEPIVYYRIKATEVSGVEKYTQTRIVKFSNKQGVSVYTAPNPFTNNFILNYRTTEKETITIRMFNVSGQQQFTKNVSVNNGSNNINITEAAQLPNGIYIIQVSNGYKLISSGKIIKQ